VTNPHVQIIQYDNVLNRIIWLKNLSDYIVQCGCSEIGRI